MTRVIASLLLFLCALPTMATDISLLVGYQWNDDFDIESSADSPDSSGRGENDLKIDDDVAFSLGVDFVFMGNREQRLGLYLSHQQTDFEDVAGLQDNGLDVTHIQLTGISYYPNGKFEPFVIAGVGVGHFSPDDSSLDNETKFSMQVGAGTNYQLTENLLLRLDIRWLPTFFDSSGSAFCSGGCTVSLSADTYSQVQANLGLMFRFY